MRPIYGNNEAKKFHRRFLTSDAKAEQTLKARRAGPSCRLERACAVGLYSAQTFGRAPLRERVFDFRNEVA
jgi:hypothetical protein